MHPLKRHNGLINCFNVEILCCKYRFHIQHLSRKDSFNSLRFLIVSKDNYVLNTFLIILPGGSLDFFFLKKNANNIITITTSISTVVITVISMPSICRCLFNQLRVNFYLAIYAWRTKYYDSERSNYSHGLEIVGYRASPI